MKKNRPNKQWLRYLIALVPCVEALDWIEEKKFKTLEEVYKGLDELEDEQMATAWLWWLTLELAGYSVYHSAKALWKGEPSVHAFDFEEDRLRWLGFIQGALWVMRIRTIENMKRDNMPDGVEYNPDNVKGPG